MFWRKKLTSDEELSLINRHKRAVENVNAAWSRYSNIGYDEVFDREVALVDYEKAGAEKDRLVKEIKQYVRKTYG